MNLTLSVEVVVLVIITVSVLSVCLTSLEREDRDTVMCFSLH